jgi:predicted CXXCH cytochrome family protein
LEFAFLLGLMIPCGPEKMRYRSTGDVKRAVRPSGRPALAALLAAALLALPNSGITDIRNTKHNLLKIHPELKQQDESAVCVFCHTPSSALNPGATPAWTRNAAGGAYATYDDIGRLGFAGNSAVGSSSMACLSCHDASQALGIELFSFDHPIGVPYRGPYPGAQAFVGAPVTLTWRNPRLQPEEFHPATRAIVENRSVFWVPSDRVSIQRQRTDLPLYTRDSEGAQVPYIECTSCHDPHSENRTFLRNAAGSKLCMTCHDK